MLCFAANSILSRLALAPRLIDAATFTTLRVFSGAVMLSLVLWLRRYGFAWPGSTNPLSVASLFTYFLFFSFAYLRLDAGSGALILIGAVQVTMFSVAFWEGERFAASQWVGLVMALIGFAYLVLPGAGAPDLLAPASWPSRAWRGDASLCSLEASMIPWRRTPATSSVACSPHSAST